LPTVATAEIQVAATSEVVIAPPTRWSAIDLGELWAHRELMYFLTKRELQVRYKQSFFGVSWAVLQPLAFAAVLAVVFGKLVPLPTEGYPYAVFALVAVVPWQFISGTISNGAGSLVQDSELISKVYFPRLALPISKAASLVVDLAVSLPVVFAVVLAYGVAIQATAPLVIAFLALGVVSAFAIGTLFAAVNVKYRDVAQIVPVFIQLMFFATPIIYSTASLHITEKWLYILSVNPFFSVIEGVRWSLIGSEYPGTGRIVVSVASAILILMVALRYFRRTEQTFADNI
jgi:homopolymeric O-antigen transport system permease protein